MRAYDEALAASTDRSPFANGTEGYSWQANWCDRCIHDKSARSDDVQPDPRNGGLVGCALLAVAIMDRTPAEWIDQTEHGHRLGDTYHCTEFRDEDDPGAADSLPPGSQVDGQLDIIDAYLDTAIGELSKAPVATS
jgi:hypothetical protein